MIRTLARVSGMFALGTGLLSAAPGWQEGALRHRWDESGQYPSFIRFAEGEGPGMLQIYPFLKDALGLGEQDQLRLNRTQRDPMGYVHYEFQQLHEGHPVTGAIYRVHFRNGHAATMNGRIQRIADDASPALSEQDALTRALEHVGASSYMWELPGEIAALRMATGDPTSNYLPQGRLTWVEPGFVGSGRAYRLAWQFDLYAHTPRSRANYFVDAETGEIIARHELLHTADVSAIAISMYSGQITMTVDSTGTGYRLRETGRANGVRTFNMQNGTSYGAAVDFTDADNFWDNINADNDHAAADGHWGAEMTHDYFWLKHGRSSFDGQGTALLSYIHYDQNYANAFWDGQRMTYGSAGNNSRPFCALDVCGHEFAHGLTGTSAGLIYQNEPGALNESFSDIFGAAIEQYARPNNFNWEIGEDLGGIRNMANPDLFNNPDTYLGNFWVTGSFDNGGVHTNSGVQNKWFHLLTVGGTGVNDNNDSYSVVGLGIDTAAMIAFRNLTVYLGPNDEYDDARYYAIESAADLFGDCSHQVIQTINAWYAVGVGQPYTGTLVADFYTPDSASCAVPSFVQFQNQSLSGLSYTWLFGDGGTSTAVNPTHTYNFPGTYTVTLIAHGCNNTHDTLVMEGRVVIDPNMPCVINMPSENGTLNHTGCAGELYDSGGNQNYLDNTFATTTINAPSGNVLTVTFQSMHMLPGDVLRIYDGTSASAPLIGAYGGTNLPPVIISTGSSLTFRESSNTFGNAGGYHATWSCAVGVDAGLMEGLDVWPNPSARHINLRMPSGVNAYRYQLLDAQGRALRSGEAVGGRTVGLDLGELARGLYFLQVEVEGQRRSQRVVLQ